MRAILSVFALLVFAVPPAPAQDGSGDRSKITRPATSLSLSVFLPDGHPLVRQVLEPFARDVEIETEGALQIQVIPDGGLAPVRDQQLDLLGQGAFDIALVLIEDEYQRFPDDRVFQLPVIRSAEEGSIAAWRLAAAGRLRGYGRYHALAVLTTPPMHIHAGDKAGSLADLQGRSFAAPGGTARGALGILGMRGVWVPLDRVEAAVNFNLVAGVLTDLPSLVLAQGADGMKHHYMMDLGVQTLALLMTETRYRALTETERAALDRFSGEVLSRQAGRVMDGLERNTRRVLSEQGNHRFTEPTESELRTARDLLAPYIEAWQKRHPNGAALYAAFIAALESVRASR